MVELLFFATLFLSSIAQVRCQSTTSTIPPLNNETTYQEATFPVDPAIIKGERVQPGEIPFQAFLLEYRENGRFQCGGSLVHPIWVFTAAHCIRAEGAYTEVRLGGTDRTNMSYVQIAELRIVHEDFGITPMENDVGLLRLPVPATGPEIGIVTLAQESLGPLTGVVLRASGFGNIRTGGPSSRHLLKVPLEGLSNEECQQTFGPRIRNSTLCANWATEEGQSTCQGDSGGPLVLIENGESVLVGVASFTVSRSRGCEAGFPQGYARVSSFRTWVEETIMRNTI